MKREKQLSPVAFLQREVNTFLTNDQKKILKDVWEQAEAMEQEIKEKEFFKGLNFGINIPNDMTPSQYYNETFKQQ